MEGTMATKRIYSPTLGPSSWKRGLASEKHWRPGFSAWLVAHCWEEDGTNLPLIVRQVLEQDTAFSGVELLLAIPEYGTPLPGRGNVSHSDVFAILRCQDGLAVTTIEAKVTEGFGKSIKEWYGQNPSKDKMKRLAYIESLLGLAGSDLTAVPYQLLHRAAAAVAEAQRFHARRAAMIVQSFDGAKSGIGEYEGFLSLFGIKTNATSLHQIATTKGVDLFSAWLCCG
jgi:hypothetical protein